jgi:phenylalanine-4-hydroxylase
MDTSLIQLDADHPGFNDAAYRARRDEIARAAAAHREGDQPPRITYTESETRTWGTVLRELRRLFPTHACREFNEVFEEIGYREDRIPQQADLHAFLRQKTGFSVSPVAGLVSSRDFLGALSRRIFPCTQYIRHHSSPNYTPEPDICHEMLGHIPMLANRDFSNLTQAFGEASVGATDAEIDQLGRLYWYTVEFGVVRQAGQLRAYGAGLLSSFGELENALSGKAEIRKFDPEQVRHIIYPITTYQPFLFEVSSIAEAFDRMSAFVARMRSER